MTTYRVVRDDRIGRWSLTIADDADQLVAVMVNGGQALAERICELLNGAAGPCPATVDTGMSVPYPRRCELLAGHAGDHKDGGMRWWDVDDDSEPETG